MESIGFKEWSLVCAALGHGEQTVILRKGGIAEGRDGFAFRHPEFFLFPTLFHAQVSMLRVAAPESAASTPELAEIRWFAKIEHTQVVSDREKVAALEPFHVLRSAVVRQRFESAGSAAIHVAFVRVFQLSPSWTLPVLPRYGGCRSWLNLPVPPAAMQLAPVLSDDAFAARLAEFRSVIAAPSAESYTRAST